MNSSAKPVSRTRRQRTPKAAPADPGPCPQKVQKDLTFLADELDRAVPAKVLDRNLLIATWNIRSLGGLTRKWMAQPGDRPKRDLHAAHAIAEIVSRFDVVAIQELKSETTALRAVYELLGEHWSLILTDVTEGKAGNAERMAFLFDQRRVHLSGLACELVIPPEHLERTEADALQRQFARTPYAVGFATLGHTITLVSLHVIWGRLKSERIRELRAIAEWLAAWSRDPHAWDHNLIALGDFNIDKPDGAYFEAFSSTGLYIPPDLQSAPRTLAAKGAKGGAVYDQIAWFEGVKKARPLTLRYCKGGSVELAHAMPSRKLSMADLSWSLSDHLPLWAEFEIPGKLPK